MVAGSITCLSAEEFPKPLARNSVEQPRRQYPQMANGLFSFILTKTKMFWHWWIVKASFGLKNWRGAMISTCSPHGLPTAQKSPMSHGIIRTWHGILANYA